MTGYASLGEVAEALRRLAANIEGPPATPRAMGDVALTAAWGLVDVVTNAWVLGAGIASIPLAIAGAWLHDHLPTRTTTTKGNHHA